MALVGLHMVTLLAKDAVTGEPLAQEEGIPGSDAQGRFQITIPEGGTRQANITGLSDTPELEYANDAPTSYTIGTPSPQVAFIFPNLPYEVKQYILGFKDDGNGNYVYTGILPQIAVIIESRTIDKKNQVYFGFSQGIFTETQIDISTNTNKDTKNTDALTYVALGDQRWDGQAIKKGSTVQKEFKYDTFEKDVFNLADPKA